jgi:hypothetical protein
VRRHATSISLDEACDLTRTGDIWIFRGHSLPDRAVRSLTNAPVNHVGMAIVVDDLPPLMWHAELGKGLLDLWSGSHQRGVQLHDLHAAVLQWGHRYKQRAWLRQLQGEVTPEMEDAALQTVARLDGTPFPSSARLAARWLRGRVPQINLLRRRRSEDDTDPAAGLETAYCAEVVAVTYEEMGILPVRHRANWYDPGRFWSGDDLHLTGGFRLGGEIEIRLPPE